ncbi:MAG: LacI family DNA-binding transcriptional regulator [Rhizobiales bacterium]|nr:LacI family DNA-binding transcriptional regulator [Hyphomicrobiales bacterium]MBI3674152.1 LacI family DNA-binding transcriptional regulator [Hyphomicrobiales bacterium]
MVRATIEDVARQAGVSVATVDRVLNGRAAVRPQTIERVEGAIRLLNYQPDRLAARLARGKEYRFCFVLPEGNNIFMIGLGEEVRAEAQRLRPEKVALDLRLTDVFDAETLARTLDQIGDIYDGVAVVALDHPRVKEAINGLAERGVTVVTLVSDVPGSKRAHYIGIDNSGAGRTAATLMGRYLGARRGKVGLIAGSLSLRDHIERQFGFEQVMMHEYPLLSVLPVREARDDWQKVEAVAEQLLAEHADLIGLYNVGAGTRGIVAALERSGRRKEVVYIAHELSEQSRRALVDGTIDVIINQDAGHEVRSAIRILMARADKHPIVEAMERIRIDIFVRDNLP